MNCTSHFKLLLTAGASLFLFSCSDRNSQPAIEIADDTLFELITAAQSGIQFVNHASENEAINVFNYEYIFNGGGVAIGDINNDGLQDVYFSGSDVPNKLFLNTGAMTFRDITEASGTAGGQGHKTGVVMVDINGDGWLDIHVCKSGTNDIAERENILYINNTDGTFTNRAQEYGLNDASFSTQIYFTDFDLDGDLDAFLVNHPVNWKINNQLTVKYDENGVLIRTNPDQFDLLSDRYYENTGGRFVDKTAAAGMLNVAFGLSASILDANSDGWPDIYVCNDYIAADQLYINQRNGSFRDAFSSFFQHSSFSSMGSDAADFDNDGHLDVLTLDMVAEDNHYQKMLQMAQNYDKFHTLLQYDYQAQFSINTLQRNNGNGTFSDISLLSGMAFTDWSWAGLMADFDLDGRKDMFITNGYRYDVSDMDYSKFRFDSLKKSMNLKGGNIIEKYREIVDEHRVSNYLFRNGGNWQMENVNASWNSGPPSFSNGAAYGDLDNDGDLDLVVNNLDDEAFLMKNTQNDSSGSHWLRFEAKGAAGNAQGIGVQITLTLSDGTLQTSIIQPARGFLSSSQCASFFGVGTSESIPRVEVEWPGGKMQTMEQVKTDQVIVLHISDANETKGKIESATPLLNDRSGSGILTASHLENVFIDFKREPLMHKKMSTQGPCMASADVNGDGLSDLFVGGSHTYEGKIVLQQSSGRFNSSAQPALSMDAAYEDAGAAFFDAEGDGDMDLYVVSGGTEWEAGNALYQDRIYLNDGKGVFTLATSALPKEYEAGSCVVTGDVDSDGDHDLFVGTWTVPGRYPEAGTCKLLINTKGTFTNESATWLSNLNPEGILCSAAFVDVDSDGKIDLVTAGEWTSVGVLRNTGTRFEEIPNDHSDAERGWWNCISLADMDGDGDTDLVCGNLGLNTRLKASKDLAVELYASDFDENGSLDAVMTIPVKGKSYPIHLRDHLVDQMTVLRKKLLRYSDYADMAITDLFSASQLSKAKTYRATQMASCYLENDGKGHFTFHPLPAESQVSTVRGVILRDFNGDSKIDILLAGNMYDTDIENSRYDASIGLMLLGDGRGEFTPLSASQSGFNARGDVRCLIDIPTTSGGLILVGRNDGEVGVWGR